MKIGVLICIIFSLFTNTSYATDAIIESQLETLDLSSFMQESREYTKEVFPNLDVDEILKSALTRRN